MAESTQNILFRVKKDEFHGELFRPARDEYPEKALICFGGSDGKFELALTAGGLLCMPLCGRMSLMLLEYECWHRRIGADSVLLE